MQASIATVRYSWQSLLGTKRETHAKVVRRKEAKIFTTKQQLACYAAQAAAEKKPLHHQ
jgi:hypothetical protein